SEKVIWSGHSITGIFGAPSLRAPVLGGTGSRKSPDVEPLTALVGGLIALDVNGDGSVVRVTEIESSRDSVLDAALQTAIASLDSVRAFAPLMHALKIKPGKSGRLNVTISTVVGPQLTGAPHPHDPPTTPHASWHIAEVWQPRYTSARR